MKSDTHILVVLLQPFPISMIVWEDLSLDFITSLPFTQGFMVNLFVVDRFSKGVHLGPLPKQYSTYKVTKLFLYIIFKYHVQSLD